MITFEEKTGKPFHVLLREFRKSSDLTQEALAVKYQFNVRTYKRWESGRCSGPTLPQHLQFILEFFKYLSDLY